MVHYAYHGVQQGKLCVTVQCAVLSCAQCNLCVNIVFMLGSVVCPFYNRILVLKHPFYLMILTSASQQGQMLLSATVFRQEVRQTIKSV